MKKVLFSVLSLFVANFTFSQNVGINATGATPDASAILDVSSTTKGMLIPRMTTANRTAITTPATGLVVYDTNLNSFYYYNGTAWIWLLSSGNGWSITGNSGTTAGTNFIGTTDAIDFVVKTNATERMRVTSVGNVGIGTSTPNAALQLGNVLSNRKLVLWEDANNDHQIYGLGINSFMLRYQVGNTSADHTFYAGTSSTTSNELMRIKGNGNVGIGTSSPAYRLDVVGSGGASIDTRSTGRFWSNSSSGGLWLSDAVDGFVGNNNTDIGFWTSGVGWNAFSITKASGNVGIGLSSPVAKLQIANNVATGALDNWSEYQLLLYQSTVAPVNSFGLGIRSATMIYNSGANHHFDVVGTTAMAINATGVGIGTTSQAVKLAVGGAGTNVYNTDIWAENNIHVQGNETMLPGGRARLRVGNAWNYAGIYSELTSTGASNDLVLGASSTWVRIGPGGTNQNLYIPQGQLLLGSDNAQKPSTSTWIITSDERLKTINGSYTKGLAEILKLNTIIYKYKNVGEKKFDEKVLATTQIGFSAQEVQKIFPEAVGVGEDGYLNLNMHAILVAYTNAIKELDAKNKEQEKINNDLKQRLEKLEALLEKSK